MTRRLPEAALGLCLLATLAVSACTSAAPVTTSKLVYVADFELEAAHVPQPESGNAPRPAPLSQRLDYGRPSVARTPKQQARDLIDLMSRSLLDDLQQAGIPAQRLPPGAPLPSSGRLVRGAFLAADAGGGLHRAVGFGADGTQIELVASVEQLGAGAPPPLYTIESTAESGKLPGAAVTLNPHLVLGRFMLTRHDLFRDVKAAAEEIADRAKM